MKLSDMRQILTDEDIQLTKSLGQKFLHDSKQLARIVAAAHLMETDRVLEIGPGLGPLTERLLTQAGAVLAIEKDRRLIEVLLRRFPDQLKLELLHADALEILRHQPRDWTEWKLVANLPYSVASPILVELAQSTRPPQRMVATLQLEVAQRLMAKPDTDDYGVLTLLVQLAYEPHGWFKIPRDCFFPAPNVDSACVTLIRRPEPLLPVSQVRIFTRLVKLGFSQRRKMMLKLLKSGWPPAKLEAAFAELGLSQQIRAEKVSLDQFVQLTQLLSSGASENAESTTSKPD